MSEASGSGGRAGGGAALAIAPAALAAAIALAALALALLAAPARSAGLDQRFGDDGRAAIGFDFEGSRPEPGVSATWEESNVEAIAGPRGSTIVVGKHQIVRLGADGRLDRGFGADGRLAPTDLAGLAFRLESAAVDGRGRLLVFGTGEDLGVSRRIGISAPAGGVDAHPSYVVVARYTPAGVLDPSFGDGDGVASSDLGLHSPDPVVGGGPAPSLVGSVGGGVDARDRPLAFVYARRLRVSKYSGAVLARTPLSLVRFSAEGGFDSAGRVPLPQGMNLRLLATPSGRLLVSGWISADEGWTVHTQIVALEPDGAIASGYGSGGSQVVVASSDAALDPKGRLLLLQAPREAGRQQVMRLRADGRLDRSFGKGGRIALRLPERGSAGSLAVDRRGRPLVAGAGVGGRLLIGRLRASGAADRRFGRHGWLRTGMGRRTTLVRPGETREYPGTVPSAALSGGRLVVADAGWSPRLRDGGVFLAGYELGR